MWVLSLCKHYDTEFREEGEEFEHSGALYEHIVPADRPEPPQQDEPATHGVGTSREQKPARRR